MGSIFSWVQHILCHQQSIQSNYIILQDLYYHDSTFTMVAVFCIWKQSPTTVIESWLLFQHKSKFQCSTFSIDEILQFTYIWYIMQIETEKIEERRFIVKMTCKGGAGVGGEVLHMIESMGLEITYVGLEQIEAQLYVTTVFIRVTPFELCYFLYFPCMFKIFMSISLGFFLNYDNQ